MGWAKLRPETPSHSGAGLRQKPPGTAERTAFLSGPFYAVTRRNGIDWGGTDAFLSEIINRLCFIIWL